MNAYYNILLDAINSVPVYDSTAILTKTLLSSLHAKGAITALEWVALSHRISDRLLECNNRRETDIKLTLKDRTSGDTQEEYCRALEISECGRGVKIVYENAITQEPEQLEIDTNEYEYFIEGA